MAKFRFREIALISLPVFFIGGFGWWASVRQTARIERESGPYRTRLVSMEDLPVTPFERWQGFDSKVRIVATDAGKPNAQAGVKLGGQRALECEVSLVGNGAEGNVKLPISDSGLGPDGVDEEHPGALMRIYDFGKSRQQAENVEMTFLADTSAFVDSQAKLRGNARVENGAYRNPNLANVPGFVIWHDVADTYTFIANPTPIEHTLAPPAAAVDRSAPQLIFAQITQLRPHEVGASPFNDGNDTLVRAQFDCSQLIKDEKINWRFVDPHLEDENGKRVELTYRSIPLNISIGEISVAADKKVSFDERLTLSQVPLARGQITLKTWFSYQDSWPTPVSIVVRPRQKLAQVPRKLQLQSVRLVGGRVEARVRYIGALPLATEQDARRKYDALSGEMRAEPRLAGVDRLISDWSQHLEYAGGKKQWSGQYIGDARAECKADKTCVVTYPLPALKRWNFGQSARFKAQIGIEDDGFLDIDLPISKP